MGNKERIGLIFLISIIAIGAIVSAVDGDGTGIAYRVAYWIDANTIGNSNITNSGTAVNTQVPLYEQGNRVCTETNGICTANLTFNETDPKVTKTNLKIPRGNGTNQIDGIQTDDGTNINNSGLYNANSYVTDSYNDQGGFSGGYVDTGIQGTFATIGGLQVGWGQNLVAAPEDLSSAAWIASNGNKGGSNLATAPNGLNHAEFWTPTSSTLNNLSTGSSANTTLGMFVFSTFLASNKSNKTSVMLGITNNNGTSCYNTVTVQPDWDRYWVTCNITTPHTIKNGSIHVIGTDVIVNRKF